MAGFAAGSGAEPVSTLAGFEVVRRNCRPTGSRWMPSSCAIRRRDQPSGNRASCFGSDREICRGSQVMVLLSCIGRMPGHPCHRDCTSRVRDGNSEDYPGQLKCDDVQKSIPCILAMDWASKWPP